MNQQPENAPSLVPTDVSGWSASRLNEFLRQAMPESKLWLAHVPENLSGVGAGLNQSIDLRIDGSVGPFAFLLSQSASIVVVQRASIACGHSFQSGSLLIHGDCDNHLGAYAMGGLITVYGKAGDYVAYGLNGGDVVVRSRCGRAAGARLRSGTLVIGNGAGEDLGFGMSGGTIYVRGTVSSLAAGVREIKLKDTESFRLGLLLARAGLKAPTHEFRAYQVDESSKAAL